MASGQAADSTTQLAIPKSIRSGPERTLAGPSIKAPTRTGCAARPTRLAVGRKSVRPCDKWPGDRSAAGRARADHPVAALKPAVSSSELTALL